MFTAYCEEEKKSKLQNSVIPSYKLVYTEQLHLFFKDVSSLNRKEMHLKYTRRLKAAIFG